jgi:hypothetical protein
LRLTPCPERVWQGMDEALLALLPSHEEVWERLAFPECVDGFVARPNFLVEDRLRRQADTVFTEAGFAERFRDSYEEGIFVIYIPPGGGVGRGGIGLAAGRFDDESVAREAVPLLLPALFGLAESLADPMEPLQEVRPPDGLGDAAIGVRGSLYPREVNLHYFWSRGNLLFWVGHWANDPDELQHQAVLEIARAMDERASAVDQ